MNGYCGKDNEKTELFDQIGELSFAMDDLRLYLDTHPNSNEALALFSEYMDKRAELVGKYTENYGPLDSYLVNASGGWDWNAAPMPWVQEASR